MSCCIVDATVNKVVHSVYKYFLLNVFVFSMVSIKMATVKSADILAQKLNKKTHRNVTEVILV